MALQMITGISGSGKSTLAYKMASDIAKKDRDKQVFVLVPDQYSHAATGILTDMNDCILNIDVLSIRRLAYRVLEVFEGRIRTVLADEGKIMLLRKVLSENKNDLKYFKNGLDRPGFLDECKSLLSEFMEYGVGDDEFDELIELFGEESRSAMKAADLKLIYGKMKERMGDTYMMAEELVPQLTRLVPDVSFLKGATIIFDEFTGFTPVQYDLISALLKNCDRYGTDVIVTLTTDITDDRKDVFSLSNTTLNRLMRLASDAGVEVKGSISADHVRDDPMLSFLERHIFCYDGEVYESDNLSSIEIRVCRNEREESYACAVEAARLVREGAEPEHIAVVTGDPGRYSPHLRRGFEAMGLPFFIDENISLGANPLAENIMAFLNMVRSGFGMEYVMRFLRTGLSPLSQSETDILENYIIASGKRGYNSFKDIWTYKPNKYMSDGALKKINDLREKFIDSIECAVNELKGQKKSIREYMQAVCRYMIDNRFYTRLLYRAELLAGADHASTQSDDTSKAVSTPRSYVSDSDLMRAAEYERLYPAMMNVFDTMVDLMGDERVSLKEFTEILGAGISEGMMGFIPQSSHRIMIGDVERSRIGDAEYVFFLGNTDDIFPKGAGSAGILNEREREKIAESDIELAPGPAELYDRELFYMYRILTKPSRRLYLSYTKTNCRGESTRASYLIRRVSSLYKYPSHEKPGLVIIDDEADTSPEKKIGIDKGLRFFITGLHDDNIKNTPDWSLIADYYEKKVPSYNNIVSPEPVNKKEAGLSPETAKALYGDVITASVTRFETFFSCPYSHFLKHGLGLKERDEYTVKPFDRGNIYHNSFERLYKKMQADKLSWKQTEAKKIIALGESCFDEEVKQYHDSLFDKDKRTAHLMKRMRLIFGDIIGRMHTQMALGEFEQELSEFSFDVDADERLKLNGRIDRIDTCVIGNDRFIKILDYKSSAKTLDLELVREGIELQLFTYMKVALEADIFSDDKKNRPAAVLFQGIDEKESEWDEKYTDHDKYEYKTAHEVRPDGYSTEEAVPYLDSMMAAGNVNSIAIHARNKKDGTYYDDAQVIPESEFLETIGQVSDKLVHGSREIYDGIIRANPFVYEKGHRDACAFCPYKNVCGMEARTKGLMAKII